MQQNEGQHQPNQVDEGLYKIRHSLAHVMAQAVLSLRPGSTLGFGPPISDGFYYDFILSEPLTEEDFPAIEKKMKHIVKQGQQFEREELDREAAMARLDEMQEPYKREYAEELFEKKGIETLSFYRNGSFLDMCEGPHVETTRQIPLDGFKIRSIAGAYWRGDSRNVMMTRLYVWAYPDRAQLDARVKAYHDAIARDHKKLGRELDLFFIDDEIGKGLPFWLPNGAVLRDELEKLAKELEFKGGYHRVNTPHLAKVALYYKTGHLPYYAKHMYPFMEVKERRETEDGIEEEVKEAYCLKPMNCPLHHRIYSSRPRSYRDLPLRLAEYGNVFRFEDSGAVSGLLRVREMCMNDAHIYCTEEQLQAEFLAVMDMNRQVFEILGLEDYYFRLSLWDPEDAKGQEKYVDAPEAWARTEGLVREAMIESGLPFVEATGEAAFYGPKVDVQFTTVTGREETASTNQVDFAIPERLGLSYTGADDQEHRPYIIHRAPLGTHERFVAFLTEHYGGAFPTWLAPVQVRVLTVGERFDGYARTLVDALRSKMVRAELDDSNETMGKKIRNAVTRKIPNVLVVGEREQNDSTVTLRRYGSRDQVTMSMESFERDLLDRIARRSLE